MLNNELELIVGIDAAEMIKPLSPKIFYKDDRPHGFVATAPVRHGLLVVSSSVDHTPFTIGMLRYIRKLDADWLYLLHDAGNIGVSHSISSSCIGKKWRFKTLDTGDYIVTICKRRR